MRSLTKPAVALTAALGLALVGAMPALASGSGLGSFSTISQVASTVPGNGDVNPYGVSVVPTSTGALHQGDVLVSNFNNSANLQGTGTTIVEVSPGGAVQTFAQIKTNQLPQPIPGGIGLTTALVALHSGWVVVGSLPTKDGMPDTIGAGGLLILDSHGKVRETISGGPINGPWDMTAVDNGSQVQLFVTNVLNGTVAAGGSVVNGGTVVRINLSIPDKGVPQVTSENVIASGFGEHTDPAALVVGPTGVAVNGETLFVADTVGNRITAIPDATSRQFSAGTGRVLSKDHFLNSPLGMVLGPNGHLFTVNAGDGNIVETNSLGVQVAKTALDTTGTPPGAGTLFGLAFVPDGSGIYFVDDGSNTLNLLH
jgi:hypothetical protein